MSPVGHALARAPQGRPWSSVALALGAAACGDASGPHPTPSVTSSIATKTSAASVVAVDPFDPSTCAPCHAAVVSEWRDSLHARAHHGADPVYAALRKLRIEKQGAQIPAQCGACHNPADVADPESKAAKLGVSCATCHQIEGVDPAAGKDGKKGIHALAPGPHGRFRGPHDVPAGASPVHANGPALPALVDGNTLCLACHAEEHNAAGIPTCATGIEHAAAGDAKPCTSCHMPEIEGPAGIVSTRARHRSHQFRGPHLANRQGAAGIVAEAVAMTGTLDGDRLVATIENRSGHAFPTGFPGRMAVVVARALDTDGKELGRNITTDAMKDHPEAVLNQGFVGDDGKPALAAFATKKVRDTRLQPDEKRELTWKLPPKTDRVELRLRFFLVPPPMAKAIGHEGPESTPIELPPVVVTR